MSKPMSDAIVFFGASGDLAYKQIFPSLLRLVRDDVVQNHMLQVLANLTMDPPTGEDFEAERSSTTSRRFIPMRLRHGGQRKPTGSSRPMDRGSTRK